MIVRLKLETCYSVKATVQDIYIKYNYNKEIIKIINIIMKINITMKINIINIIMIVKKIKKIVITTITVIAVKLVKTVITIFLVIIGDINWRSHLVTQTDYH